MINASVELDPGTLSPTYRLTLGLPGRSYALTIAARMGLKAGIIEKANAMLAPGHRQAESLLQDLQKERHLAEGKRKEAETALHDANARNKELEEQNSPAAMSRYVEKLLGELQVVEETVRAQAPVPRVARPA